MESTRHLSRSVPTTRAEDQRAASKPHWTSIDSAASKVHPLPKEVLLVPIPSWKKKRGNPLPNLIAAGFGQPSTMLLHRTRAGLSQHHLNRSMQMQNLEGAFHAAPARHTSTQPKTSVWLVDDILKTGPTALAAQKALNEAEHSVRGIICLGRTPAKRLGR